MQNIIVAISPCPNDTFIFGAWILGLLPKPSPLKASFVFADVQELNVAAEQDAYDVVKVSAVQAIRLETTHVALKSGGAFGLSAGPKLVVPRGGTDTPLTIAVPGLKTTAWELLKAAADWNFEPVEMRYDRIMDAVTSGKAQGGLLIHESALAFEQHGLHCCLDLGAWWNTYAEGFPLPLGTILASRRLPCGLRDAVNDHIRRSIEFAKQKPDHIRPLIRSLAQEMDDTIIAKHIHAYVSHLTVEPGREGIEAMLRLKELMNHPGAFPATGDRIC
ncbi:MAG: MqnA/MqnD/SBP family protein [Desulfovibrionales bacterium]